MSNAIKCFLEAIGVPSYKDIEVTGDILDQAIRDNHSKAYADIFGTVYNMLDKSAKDERKKDYVLDFLSDKFMDLMATHAKNVKAGKAEADKIFALMKTAFENAYKDKYNSAKSRANRERTAGNERGVSMSNADLLTKVDSADRQRLANTIDKILANAVMISTGPDKASKNLDNLDFARAVFGIYEKNGRLSLRDPGFNRSESGRITVPNAEIARRIFKNDPDSAKKIKRFSSGHGTNMVNKMMAALRKSPTIRKFLVGESDKSMSDFLCEAAGQTTLTLREANQCLYEMLMFALHGTDDTV